VAIWQHYKRVLSIFSPRMRRNAIYELPVKNLTPPFAPATSISYMTDAFPLPSDVYGIYSMFLCYYVACPCDLDLWPFDLESVSRIMFLMSDPHTNFYCPMTIGYWVTSTEYLITFPLSETVTAHAPCHVTSNQGQKWSTFLKSLTQICLFTMSLSRLYDED